MWETHLLHRRQSTLSLSSAAACYQANLGRERRDIDTDWLETRRGRGQRQRLYKQARKGLRQCLQNSLRILTAAARTPLLTRLCWSLVFVTDCFICGKLPTIHHTWGSTVLNIGKCLIWGFKAFKQRCFYCLHCCSFKPWSTMQDKSMLHFWSSLFAALFITPALQNQ